MIDQSNISVSIIEMSSEEANDSGLTIYVCSADSPFGKIIMGASEKGLCFIGFDTPDLNAVDDLKERFPNSRIFEDKVAVHDTALAIINGESFASATIALHLHGTPFQLDVWKALLTIPTGSLTTYSQIAKQIGSPSAARAVGTAIGRNPVSIIIPCHRVLQASGKIGGYMWGSDRKSAIIAKESDQLAYIM